MRRNGVRTPWSARDPRIALFLFFLALTLSACGFDDSLREYLSARFWLPFAKHASNFEKPNIRRTNSAFAGMTSDGPDNALSRLRTAYQLISNPDMSPGTVEGALHRLAEVRNDSSLTPREKEEVDLLDAKIDLRAAERDDTAPLDVVERKFQAFLTTARIPAFQSEARGWLAHVYYLEGDQTRAGKMYLDELNRPGSNLSRETLLNSLRLTYEYTGGQELLDHIGEYFDTPEHAIFAIQLATNPRWEKTREDQRFTRDQSAKSYAQIRGLLQKHSKLLHSDPLAMLSMRTALRMGDLPGARAIAETIPATSTVRADPDFLWMLASIDFLSHDYAAAEQPLLDLFHSKRSTDNQRAAAAYGLCGVYQKTHKPIEQIRYALWLRTQGRVNQVYEIVSGLSDFTVYWAVSGFDLSMLLDVEAPVEALQSFIEQNPNVPDLRVVRYALGVRLARENRYDESAQLFESIEAGRRAPRMRRLAELYKAAIDPQGKFAFAKFVADNENGIYFDDLLWSGYQRYGLTAENESRFTAAERERHLHFERQLKDDQEEYWRAYHLLREVMRESNDPALSRKAAQLAQRSIRRMSQRFGRLDELQAADRELSAWLAKQR